MSNVKRLMKLCALGALCLSGVAGELTVEKVWPEKLYCPPGSAQKVTTTLRNSDAKAREARLLVELRSGFDKSRTLFDATVGVPANATLELPLDFKADPAYLGWEAAATVFEGGKAVSTRRDYFGVAPTPWPVAHYDFYLWSYGLEINATVKSMRDNYCCVLEQFGFSPSYVSRYIPDTEEWISNCGYRESKSTMRALVRKAHENGIDVMSYIWFEDFGPTGFDFVRKHPEFIQRDKAGNWQADYNVEALDKLEDDAFRYRMRGEYDRPGSDKMSLWYPIKYDWHNLALVEHHAAELIRSKPLIGYDGYRYDCELSSAPCPDVNGDMPKNPLPQDELGERNHRMIQDAVRKAQPGTLFGYNYGARQTSGSADRLKAWHNRFQGNFVLFEDTVALWIPNNLLNNWEAYRQSVKDESRPVIDQGGFFFVHLARDFAVKTTLAYEYQVALAFASRAHLSAVNSATVGIPDKAGPKRLNAYSLRFADHFFDPGLKELADVEKRVAVSDKSLWWKEYSYTHQFEGNEEWVIHLINPPLSNTPDPAMTQTRPPCKDATVTLTHPEGRQIAKVRALSPDGLEPVSTPPVDGAKITVPELKVWSTLCVEWR